MAGALHAILSAVYFYICYIHLLCHFILYLEGDKFILFTNIFIHLTLIFREHYNVLCIPLGIGGHSNK